MLCYTITPEGHDIVPGFYVEFAHAGRPYVGIGTRALVFSDELIANATLTSTNRLLRADVRWRGTYWELTPEVPQETPGALAIMLSHWLDFGNPAAENSDILMPDPHRTANEAFGFGSSSHSILVRLAIGGSIGHNTYVSEEAPARQPRNLGERLFGVPKEYQRRVNYRPVAVFTGEGFKRTK